MPARPLFILFGFLLLLYKIHSEDADKNTTDLFASQIQELQEYFNTTENLPSISVNCTFIIEEEGKLITVEDKTREELEIQGKKIHNETCTEQAELDTRLSYGALASLAGG